MIILSWAGLKISLLGQYSWTKLAALSASVPGPVSKLTMYLIFGQLVDSRMILGLTSLLCSMNSSCMMGGRVAVSQTVCVLICRTYQPSFVIHVRYSLEVLVR